MFFFYTYLLLAYLQLHEGPRGPSCVLYGPCLFLSSTSPGCCGVAAHVDGPHLHIANAGDCGAVLGTQNEDGSWEAKMLTAPHHANCKSEQVINSALSSLTDERYLFT